MSLPERPGANPLYEQRNSYRQSPSRRQRPTDVEAGGYYPVPEQHQRGPSVTSFAETLPSPNGNTERVPLSPSPDRVDHGPEQPFQRKRSLIRPERNRINKDHPNYHYRMHAANMITIPSSTGNDPILEDLDASTELSGSRVGGDSPPRPTRQRERISSGDHEKGGRTRRRTSGQVKGGKIVRKDTKKSKEKRVVEQIKPPSLWTVYCAIITFWCPDFVLRSCCHKPSTAQQRAWREKMGLISIILFIMAFVGFLTFGFNQAVCGSPSTRLRVNYVTGGFMIFHGVADDLTTSHHPAAEGIPRHLYGSGANVLFDLPQKHGGQDGSFLFQNVNGKCKGIINRADGSKIPTDASGNLARYFPLQHVQPGRVVAAQHVDALLP